MEKDLKNKLQNFLNHFHANEINHYFACEFSDDWDEYYIKNNYSNIDDTFIDIDVDYRGTNYFEMMVKNTLENALKMLKEK